MDRRLMRANRFLAIAAALFIAVLPARADQILGPGRITSGNKVVLPGGPTLGLWQNGQFISQPYAIQIQGSGSTGDVSAMSVTASGTTSTLAGWLSSLSSSVGSTFTGTATWTPIDNSGTGLAFTVQDAQWTQIGKVCTITFALTYPTTASSAAASIGGLPCAGQTGAASRAGGAPSYTDFATPFTVLIGSGTTTANFYAYGGAGLANSQLSGKSIRATLTYITN